MGRSRGHDRVSKVGTSPSKAYRQFNMARSKKLDPFRVHSTDPHHKPIVQYNTNKKSSNPSGSQKEPRIEIAQTDGTIRTHRGSLVPPSSTIAGDPLAAQASTESARDDVFSSSTQDSPEDVPSFAHRDALMPAPSVPPAKLGRIRSGYRREKASAWRHWRQDVLYNALEVYLDVEAQRASGTPIEVPPQVLQNSFKPESRVGNNCPRCSSPIKFHMVMTIEFSCE